MEREIFICADRDTGAFLGRHAGDLPENCVIVDTAPDDDRQVWDGKQWVLPDDQHNADMEAERRKAYEAEADPLAMQMLREEATKEDWLAKIEEIKERFPKKGDE